MRLLFPLVVKKRFSWAVFVALLLSGCATRDAGHNELGVPDYTIANVYAADPFPFEIQRVVVLPIHSELDDPGIIRELDATFRGELGQTRRFELVMPNRVELADVLGQETFSTIDPVPFGFFEYLREYYDADAVLFLEIPHYRAYRPIMIGVRARLIDLYAEETVWALEEVFDSGNPQVSVSAQRYQRNFNDRPFPLDTSGSVLISPARFSKYVAWQTFQALPGG